LPWLIIGRRAPRPEPAGFSGLRLKKMLKNARKRCQATPIVTFSEMVISQLIEMAIFTSAVQVAPSCQAGSSAPMPWLTGVAQSGYSNSPIATLKPRIRKPQIRTATMIASTKYACHIVEPVKRERPLPRPGLFSCRIAMSTRMPIVPKTPIHSVTRPKTVQCPMIGRPRRGLTTSKYASSTSSESTTNATMTNQWAAPTTPHLSIRV
jgi:hypothetical protein